MKTKTLSLSAVLGLTFAALALACSAQPLPEDGAPAAAASAEPTETTHEALANNGATECPQGDACQCQGQEECLELGHNCRGFWYCNHDIGGSNLRCICWQNARVTSPIGTVTSPVLVQPIQP